MATSVNNDCREGDSMEVISALRCVKIIDARRPFSGAVFFFAGTTEFLAAPAQRPPLVLVNY